MKNWLQLQVKSYQTSWKCVFVYLFISWMHEGLHARVNYTTVDVIYTQGEQ